MRANDRRPGRQVPTSWLLPNRLCISEPKQKVAFVRRGRTSEEAPTTARVHPVSPDSGPSPLKTNPAPLIVGFFSGFHLSGEFFSIALPLSNWDLVPRSCTASKAPVAGWVSHNAQEGPPCLRHQYTPTYFARSRHSIEEPRSLGHEASVTRPPPCATMFAWPEA